MSSPKIVKSLLLVSLAVIAALSFSLWKLDPLYADGPPPDYACRGCHGDNHRELTLPSGETMPLLVSLEALNNSPHSLTAEPPGLCTTCHTGVARYQYPHRPNPAQTRRDFVLAMSEKCQDCHYPHNPFHAADDLAAQSDPPSLELPICVDCHGSHQIDTVDNILNSMPQACVTCHTDQSPDWAAGFFAPRPGVGEPAAGYIGSSRCAGCHEEKYFSWRETLHARMIQDPVTNPAAIVGDFNLTDPDLTFDLDDVTYTIGSRWQQHYLAQDETGAFFILPAQWNVETAEWVPYQYDNNNDNALSDDASDDDVSPIDSEERPEWLPACGSCHVTGLNTETWGFAEIGVGCESCHGPGADHAADPETVSLFATVDDQVCGACHSRGISPDGLPFPATYRPGDQLTDHFTFTTAETDIWPDGSAKKNHQQYMDWQLGSRMALSVDTNCVLCHSVHDSGIGQTQLFAPLNDLCWQCHNNKRAIVNHVPFHDRAINKHAFVCSDCHMPKMATSAIAYDIHNHSFLQPDPQASLDHGGVDQMMNSCNTCHVQFGEDPQWAVDTITYVANLSTSSSAVLDIFGPGPTPTAPPPPTPLPSVGQRANVEEIQVETGRWLRNSALAIFGLIVLAGLFLLAYRFIRARIARRSSHV